MHSRQSYSLTDAMTYCLQQPGVTAASFVDIETGEPIAMQGAPNSQTDTLIPYLTDWYRSIYDQYQAHYVPSTGRCESTSKNCQNGFQRSIGEVKVTLGDSSHLIYPLAREGKGLYLYLTLDREKRDMPLIRHCLSNINERLHLSFADIK